MNDENRIVTVFHIIPEERFGGPQLRILQTAKRLKEVGFSLHVAMPEGDKSFANLLYESGIPYYQVKNFRRLRRTLNPIVYINWFFFFIPGVFSLIKLIRKNKADIVHTHAYPIYLQGPLAAKLSGTRLVWQLDDAHIPKWLKAPVLPFLHFLPDKVAVGSKAVSRHYFGDSTFAKNTVVLYPPQDTSKFNPDTRNIKEYRKEFGLELNDKLVGIIANINPIKGYEYFFTAAKLIKEAFHGVKFLVVGKRLDTQQKYWQKLHHLNAKLHIEDDIILAGYRTDIPEILNSLDVFVLTSLSEASPTVIMEAMACARPVVATKVGGVPELVIDKETGILVPPGDPKAISEAVLYLLNHPEEAMEMGLKGRQRVIDHFDLTICSQKHVDVYEQLLSSTTAKNFSSK